MRVVITGASGGIGHAIAARFAAGGADLCLVGRSASSLNSIRAAPGPLKSKICVLACDLDKDDDLSELHTFIEARLGGLDVLIHSAGVIALAPLATVSAAEMDRHYRINVRAPLILTQSLLPLLRSSRGQIVFINSSVGVRAKEQTGAYAASKHALKALADTFRMELNAVGIRVVSVFPGNTATPMQQHICASLEKPYVPQWMLQPDDVARAVVDALLMPRTAEVTDIHLRPALKPPQ